MNIFGIGLPEIAVIVVLALLIFGPVDKVEDPKGDRVLVKMCGKFLPYKKW